ncbi:hypothetical protein RclHR1_09050003 [Rhizophagus clarus]|uniref:Uncharacterized protein n=1 Tax=Rhizophagus clarus TaxID=94130 RepID=A0A2Z6S975_9GLOM|nr:hypothetical protein RclHR1_09050003 [Rhizophagus clarus]
MFSSISRSKVTIILGKEEKFRRSLYLVVCTLTSNIRSQDQDVISDIVVDQSNFVIRWWIFVIPVEVYCSVELEALRGHSCAALWRKAYCERPSLIFRNSRWVQIFNRKEFAA